MLDRLRAINPWGLALLLVGVAVMVCGKWIPEKFKTPAKLVALFAALAGALVIFLTL